jgi:hypothetical protein
VKLTRLSRISRLLRSVPELAIIVCLAVRGTGDLHQQTWDSTDRKRL